MTDLELLKEIRNDFVDKFDNDPRIRRVCNIMINEYKKRKQEKQVNRFEVIDKKGRAYVNYNVHRITRSLQDNDKTFKIFIE